MAARKIETNNEQVQKSEITVTPNKEAVKPVEASNNGSNGAITLTNEQKTAMVQEKAAQLGIQLQKEDIQHIAVTLKDTFSTQAKLTKSINAALVAFQQRLNKYIEDDNRVTTEALVFLRNRQNKKTAEYLNDLNSNIEGDCKQWQELASFAENLFGETDLGENNQFDFGL